MPFLPPPRLPFDRPARLAGALLLSLLGACAGTPDCPPAQGTTLTIPSWLGLPIVDATANGRRVGLLLDTGAARTVLTATTAARLGVATDPTRVAHAYGIGGVSESRTATLSRFTFGPIDRLAYPMPVQSLPPLETMRPPLQGLLGADMLAEHAVDLDLPHQQMTLYPAAQCRAAKPNWSFEHHELPARLSGDGRLLLEASLDGHRLVALPDTGANVTSITRRTAERLGITPAMLAAAPGRPMQGAGATVTTRMLRLRSLRLGPLLVEQPLVLVMEQEMAEGVEIVIGTDILMRRRLWLTYATPRAFMAGAAANPPASPSANPSGPRSSTTPPPAASSRPTLPARAR